MDEKNLARSVAADLGTDVLAAVEAPPADDRTRAFGITEAMAVGGFLAQCAHIAIQVWQARQDRALLVEALVNSDKLMQMYPRLDPEKRLGLAARILKKLLPDSFAKPTHDHGAVATDKRNWVTSYLASRGTGGVGSSRYFQGG